VTLTRRVTVGPIAVPSDVMRRRVTSLLPFAMVRKRSLAGLFALGIYRNIQRRRHPKAAEA
jgi:hypothetical protein